MDKQDLLNKLAQIEEQAKHTLADFPTLTKERLRMIIALARYLRTEMSSWSDPTSDAGLDKGQDNDPHAGRA